MAHLLAVVMAAGMMGAVQPDVPQHGEFFTTVYLVGRFPSPYFDLHDRLELHRVALTRWPGPSGLLRLWREGQLQEVHRVSLLLGGAAFRDPQLLPMYAEGLRSQSQLVRQAAAYGYRDLIADSLPAVGNGVDDAAAAALIEEIQLMAETLRRRPLSAVWVDALMLPQGHRLPGSDGIVPRRTPIECLLALDRVLQPEDLPLLLTAVEMCPNRQTKAQFVQLVEAVSLKSFTREPPPGRPWGTEVHRDAAGRMERWREGLCRSDFEDVLARSMAEQGAGSVDPMSPGAFWVWYRVLQGPKSAWWPLAARELYRLGAPPAFLTGLSGREESCAEERDRLLAALRTVPTRDQLMRRPADGAAPPWLKPAP